MVYAHLTDKARKVCVESDPVRPKREHDFSLVHASGTAQNKVNLQDRDFGVVA